MDTIFALGLQGLVAYGAVGLLSLILKRKGIELSSEVKTYVLIGIAFAVGFVPAELGSVIFDKLKEAIAIGLSLSTISTLANKAGGTK